MDPGKSKVEMKFMKQKQGDCCTCHNSCYWYKESTQQIVGDPPNREIPPYHQLNVSANRVVSGHHLRVIAQ